MVLSSSALTIHAEPVARYLGITHVLCNHFELDGHGALTCGIVRPVLWGQQKAVAVQDFLQWRTVLSCNKVTSTPTETRTWR